jgi:hypothetical protein
MIGTACSCIHRIMRRHALAMNLATRRPHRPQNRRCAGAAVVADEEGSSLAFSPRRFRPPFFRSNIADRLVGDLSAGGRSRDKLSGSVNLLERHRFDDRCGGRSPGPVGASFSEPDEAQIALSPSPL